VDPETLLNEDPVLTEKKSKKYEIKLKDLSKKHQVSQHRDTFCPHSSAISPDDSSPADSDLAADRCAQELIVRGEAAASLLRAQVARLAALRREVKFLKTRKQCWDEVLRPVKRRRTDADKQPVGSRRDRGLGGAGEAAGSRPAGSSKTGNRRREDGQRLPHQRLCACTRPLCVD
jgi:hypothetical protein